MGKITAHTLTKQSFTVSWVDDDDKSRFRTINADDPVYEKCKEALKDGDEELILKLLYEVENKVKASIDKTLAAGVELVEGRYVTIDGETVGQELSKRIMDLAEEGLPFDAMVEFWRNLSENPSFRAVTGLFRFLETNHFPITPDGHFIAWKGIGSNFKDLHSNTMDNSVGAVVKMPRNHVNEDPNVACATGLHVASHEYATENYGGAVVVEVKVNPKNVVAVPYDHNSEKLRACEYKVVRVAREPIMDQVFDDNALDNETRVVDIDNDYDDDDDEDYNPGVSHVSPYNDYEDDEDDDDDDDW